MASKTYKKSQLRKRVTFRQKGGVFWSKAKVAPSPEKRKIESQFDLCIDKFNGSLADETGQTEPSKMLNYYTGKEEYTRQVDTDLQYPYMGKKLTIVYKGAEEYAFKHDFSVCDIEALTQYIAEKRMAGMSNEPLKLTLQDGALYIIKTILEKIGTDVTTDSVKRFMVQYIWKDTPLIKKKLDDSVKKFNEVKYTAGDNGYKAKLRESIKRNREILTGMLCVRVLIRKKFNDLGHRMPDELNDMFSGMNASLFNAPAPLPPTSPPAAAAPQGFIQRCIDGVCSLFRIKK
jgi:hypothetical protein